MKNTDIFRDYDMVVSITQKTINDQLYRLLNQGIIRDELILKQDVDDDGNFTYKVLNSENEIPKDNSSIAGKITPTIDIQHSGTNVNFVLNFDSGTAYFWYGNGPSAKLKQFNMAGWTYTVVVTLDLRTVEKEDIGKGIKVPEFIENQLKNFTDQMFSVNHLFMDFESTDLLRFDPTKTSAGTSGDTGIEQFVTFMQFYLKYLLNHDGNPYILGYAITTNNETQYPQNMNIPDSLKPVGTTYSMFHDNDNNDNSTLNFVLTTKGGHPGILDTPGNFDSNWILPNDKCEAKMIYSRSRLLEEFILKPFYNQLVIKVRDQIKDKISFEQENSYETAKQNKAGFDYTIYDVNYGDNRYVNTYTVDISNRNTGTEIDLVFKGHIYVRKEVSKEMVGCTAEAWAESSVDWSTTVSITSTDSNISVENSPVTLKTSQDSYKNECAKVWEELGDIFQFIFDIITEGLGAIFFGKLIESFFETPIPGIGNLNLALNSLNNSISTTVMLPAGQVFSFKDPSADKEGNTYLKLMYR